VNLYSGSAWHSRASALIKLLYSKRGQFYETLSDEVWDFVTVLGHSIELIDQVAVTDQVHYRHVLNSEHLSDLLMFVDVNIQVLNLALMLLHSINQHGLQYVARSAPGGASLDQNGSLTVLQRILPVPRRLHLFDVAWLLLTITATRL